MSDLKVHENTPKCTCGHHGEGKENGVHKGCVYPAKVKYLGMNEYSSTAYLDYEKDGEAVGVDKHSDYEVRLVWMENAPDPDSDDLYSGYWKAVFEAPMSLDGWR